MTAAERYRLNAQECEYAASRSAMARDRVIFQQMAERWRAMADEAERPSSAPPEEPKPFDRRRGC